MKMPKHEDFVVNNSPEKYVLHQLKGENEIFFEEHLLYCNYCREEVQKINLAKEAVIDYASISDGEILKEFKINKQIIHLKNYFNIAATILIIVAIAWLVMYYSETKKNTTKNILVSKNIELNKTNKSVSIEEYCLKNKSIVTHKYENTYKEYASFETLVGDDYRSDGISVVTPQNSCNFEYGEKIIFIWSKSNITSLTLVIFNNKGKVVFEKLVNQKYEFNNKLKSGLYYWQLETDKDAIYTGKFTVK